MLSRRPSVPPAHTLLRRATLRLHHRIDRTSVLAVLTQPGLRLSAYTSAMVALQQAYLPLDLLLSNSAHLCPATVPAYVPRSLLITRDLLPLHASLTNPIPPVRLTGPETEAAYLGIRYVVEGAQLGSRVIYGHLLKAFGSNCLSSPRSGYPIPPSRPVGPQCSNPFPSCNLEAPSLPPPPPPASRSAIWICTSRQIKGKLHERRRRAFRKL